MNFNYRIQDAKNEYISNVMQENNILFSMRFPLIKLISEFIIAFYCTT